MNPFRQVRDFCQGRLWEDEGLSPGALWCRKACRLFLLAARGLGRNRSLVRASALAYATILALIPLLALLFALFTGLGLQRLLSSQVLERLAPGSQEFAVQIFHYIEGLQVTSLGVFGVVFLLAALVVVMTNVERSFNETWGVSQTRPFRRKLSDYLSIFLIFPVLMAGVVSLSSSFLGHPEIRRLFFGLLPAPFYSLTTALVHLGLLWVAFTFMYLVMPNTRVYLLSALVGGIVGGSLWQVAQWIFIWFQGAATYYNAIYGALYHLLFLIIWMFWSWLIVLFGTEVAYAHQNLERLSLELRRPGPPQEPVDEYLALAAFLAVAARFQRRQPPLALPDLAHLFQDREPQAARLAEVLQTCDLLVQVCLTEHDAIPRFLPSQPLDQVTVGDILQRLRAQRGLAVAAVLAGEPRLAEALRTLAESPSPAWQDLSIADLLQRLDEVPPDVKAAMAGETAQEAGRADTSSS